MMREGVFVLEVRFLAYIVTRFLHTLYHSLISTPGDDIKVSRSLAPK
jgi:hypothetical protein